MKKTIATLLSAALALTSCAKNDTLATTAPQNTYVLVHGAWQAPWVWDAVAESLKQKGYKVITVELPGHGKDTTPTYSLSLDAYSSKVAAAISGTEGKVILVGHSMGGMVVTQVAEKLPSRIAKLVYIGAFVPENGQNLGELAMLDPDSRLRFSLSPSADQLTLHVQRDSLTTLFINDGSKADKDRMLSFYRAEPAIPFGNKVTLTKGNFGAVEKVYIKTLQDIVITPGFQDRMIAKAGIKTVYNINTSHSPFLAQSAQVTDLLVKAAQ